MSLNCDLRMVRTATILTASSGGAQSGNTGVRIYVAKIKEQAVVMTARTKMYVVHRQMNAGKRPNPRRMYVYSPPERGMVVPSSA